MTVADKKQSRSKSKIQDLGIRLSYLPRTLQLIWTAAPALTASWAGVLVLQGLLPVISVYLIKLVVDGLVKVVNSPGNWQLMVPVITLIVFTVVVMLLSDLLDSLGELIRTAQSELTFDHITALLHQQALALDISFYESPDYHDLLERARSEAGSRSRSLLESLGSLTQNAITLIGMAAVLINYAVWLPLVLLIGALPAFYVLLRFDRLYHRWWQTTTTDRRRTQYFDMMLTHTDAAAEIRLFDLGTHFQSAYKALRARLLSERLRHMKKQTFARLGAGVLGLSVSGLVLAWMLWRAFLGQVSLGDLALFYQAINRGQGLMRTLLSSAGKVYSSTLFMSNLFAFLEIQAAVVNPVSPLPVPKAIRSGVSFRDVTFNYPDASQSALRNFNLDIPAGKIVAVVGPNGPVRQHWLSCYADFMIRKREVWR